MNDLMVKEQWYEALIDECKDIITETIFTSRWALVEGYHKLGERILEDEDKFPKDIRGYQQMSSYVTTSLGCSQRTIERAIQFAKKYPSLDNVPEGKNISWNKICNLYLPEPKENKIELPLPDGKFSVIVIDPPWPYGTQYDKDNRRVASPYTELSIKELEAMTMPAADDCSLWLWTTHKFIWDAKKLMELWGFEYKAILVWNKEKMGMGVWLRMQCEFCLVGIKGSPSWAMTNQRDILTEARGEHSVKPDSFYKLVESVCKGKKIDIFSRKKRTNWTIYGNETEKF